MAALYRLLVLSSGFVGMVAGAGCSICGQNHVVKNPDVIAPVSTNTTCGTLQAAAEAGILPDGCTQALINEVYGPCGCEESDVPVALETCNICGQGKVVTKPDVSGVIPGHPNATCGEFQMAAETHGFSSTTCDILPAILYTDCGCEDDPIYFYIPSADDNTTDSSAGNATEAPVVTGCNICGDGMMATNEETLLVFPMDDEYHPDMITKCKNLEAEAADGEYTDEYCAALPDLIGDACGCVNITEAPSVAPVTTPAPVTKAPTTAVPNLTPATPAPVSTAPVSLAPTEPCSNTIEVGHCYVCGEGNCVADTGGKVHFNAIVRSCLDLQTHVAQFSASEASCKAAQLNVINQGNPCGCPTSTARRTSAMTDGEL